MQVGFPRGPGLSLSDLAEFASTFRERVRRGYRGGVRDYNNRVRSREQISAGRRVRQRLLSESNGRRIAQQRSNSLSDTSARISMPFSGRSVVASRSMRGSARSGGGPPRGRRRRRVGRRKAPRGRRGATRSKKRRVGGRKIKFGSSGSTKVVENGGVVIQSETGYIGVYSSPVVQIVESSSRAIYRALMKEAGIDFGSWTERHRFYGALVNPYWIHVEYLPITTTPPTGTTVAASTFDIAFDNTAGNQTHGDVANALNKGIWDIVEAGIPLYLQEVQLFCTAWDSHGETEVEKRMILAQLRPRHMKLHIETSNKLEIQNRTKAADASATKDEQVNESALNINANPIQGYSYSCSGSGFVPKTDDYARAEYGLRSDPLYGLIQSNAIGGNVTHTPEQELKNYIKPPLPKFFQKTIGKKLTVQPGAMTSITASYKKTMPLNDLYIKYLPTMQLFNTFIPTVNSYRYPYLFGQSKMFALERKIDTRDSSDAQPITIGYEFTLTVASTLTKVQQFLAPINEVL